MSKKRRAVVKSMTPRKLLDRQVSRANVRLTKLKKAGFSNTWASRKLYDRLTTNKVNVINKKTGKIELPKNINKAQKRLIEKSVYNFMRSETSTPRGIEEVRQKTIKSLAKTLGEPEKPMSYEDAETYYNMFGDNDFTFFSDRYGASDIWALIETSIEMNDSLTDFLERFQVHLTEINDDDLLERATRLYEKYII